MAIIKFKVSRDRCYTVVNNTFINDNQLDAREKGLLLVIMSKPDNWDMSVEGLRSFCSDGTTSLRKGIQKLEEHGYLLRLNVRNARGNFGSMPYVVFERPLPEEKRNNPDYNPLDDAELNDTFEITDADRTRWLSLTLGKISAGHRVRAQRSAAMKPSLENQPAEIAAAENRPQINTVIPSNVPQKKIDINTSLRAVESYPSYPSVSGTAGAAEIPSPVDNSVDNPVDNVNAGELAASEHVTTLYQQISDFARTHSIVEVHEFPPVAAEDQWFSAYEDHLAEPAFTDCWAPQRPRKDSRFDNRYAFDAFMQSDRQRHTCSRYTPSEYSYVKDLIKERICYDALCEQFGKDRVDTVVDIIMEINSAVSGTFRVEGVEISVRDMKIHFAKVNQFHVERMFENLDKHYDPIKCRKSYMRTTLYNVIITMDEEIRAQVRQDHPFLFMENTPQFIPEEQIAQMSTSEASYTTPYVCA